MLVIVEGIDRVGKGTLIDKLVNEFDFKMYKHDPLVHYDEMDSSNETDKVLQLFEMIELINADVDIVIDRASWSDFVYGVIERDYNCYVALRNLRLIEKKFNELNGVLVYVRPTNIEWSSEQHGKSLKVHSDLFDIIIDKSICNNIITCDYNSIEWAINNILTGGD